VFVALLNKIVVLQQKGMIKIWRYHEERGRRSEMAAEVRDRYGGKKQVEQNNIRCGRGGGEAKVRG